MIRKTHVHLSDLVGLNRLATDVTAELTDLAEALHNNIAGSPGLRGTPMQERTSTIAGLVYESVREVTRLVGGTTDAYLRTNSGPSWTKGVRRNGKPCWRR